MSRFERINTGTVTPIGPAGGDLSGTYPAPAVARITENSGVGASLGIAAIADGEVLARSGGDIVGISVALLTAVPPVNVTKSAAALGVSPEAARSDHKHDVTTAAPLSTLGGESSNTEGALTTLARSDHSHDVATGTPTQIQAGTAAAEGAGNALARASHLHSISTASGTSLPIGGGSAEGTAVTLARSDHKHGLPSFGSAVGTIAQGNDARFPSTDEKAALVGTSGSPSGVNKYVTNADLRLTNSRIPTGAAGGQLGGTYPNPDVRGIRETFSSTLLAIGPIQDGQTLVRSGAFIVGAYPPGMGDVQGSTPSLDNQVVVFSGLTGKLIKAPNASVGFGGYDITSVGNVDGRDVSADGSKLDTVYPSYIPTIDEKAALGGTSGTPSSTNKYVTDSDSRNTDSRVPTGSAGGQLGSTYPDPDVRGIRETTGPTLLTFGSIPDTYVLVRSGTTVVGESRPKISTTTPENVSKSVAAIGVGATAARSDHKHDIDTATPGSVSIGTTAAEGVATTLARSDHTHGVGTPAAPADVTKAAAGTGSSGTPARADHKHDVSTAVPNSVLIGDTQTEGTATSLARSDHKHAVASPAAPENVTKAAASAGTSTGPARSDHKHDVTTAAPSTNISTSTTNTEGAATSLARSDHSHKVVLPTQQVTATADTTTGSLTDTPVTGMSITPGAGDYLVMYSSTYKNSNNGQHVYCSLYVNGTKVTHTERSNITTGGNECPVAFQAVVTGVTAGQTLTVQWRVTNNTGTMRQRALTLLRIN